MVRYCIYIEVDHKEEVSTRSRWLWIHIYMKVATDIGFDLSFSLHRHFTICNKHLPSAHVSFVTGHVGDDLILSLQLNNFFL